MLQKITRGGIQKRPPGYVRAPRNSHQAPIQKHGHDPIDRNSSHGLDISASDWLPVGDDRKCFQRGAAQSGGLCFWKKFTNPWGVFRPAHQRPAVHLFNQLKCSLRRIDLLLQFTEHGEHTFRVNLPVLLCLGLLRGLAGSLQRGEKLRHRDRFGRGENKGLQNLMQRHNLSYTRCNSISPNGSS